MKLFTTLTLAALLSAGAAFAATHAHRHAGRQRHARAAANSTAQAPLGRALRKGSEGEEADGR